MMNRYEYKNDYKITLDASEDHEVFVYVRGDGFYIEAVVDSINPISSANASIDIYQTNRVFDDIGPDSSLTCSPIADTNITVTEDDTYSLTTTSIPVSSKHIIWKWTSNNVVSGNVDLYINTK